MSGRWIPESVPADELMTVTDEPSMPMRHVVDVEPVVESIKAAALAVHEAEKRRAREARERDRLAVLFGGDLAEVKLFDYMDPRAAVQIGDEVILVDCFYDAARNVEYADKIAAAHNAGMFQTQDGLMEAMPALREAFGTPPAST